MTLARPEPQRVFPGEKCIDIVIPGGRILAGQTGPCPEQRGCGKGASTTVAEAGLATQGKGSGLGCLHRSLKVLAQLQAQSPWEAHK